MVLLSFFILFFSMADKKEDIIRKLIPATALSGEASTSTDGDSFPGVSQNISSAIHQIEGLTVKQVGNTSVLNVQFPENIYSEGSADLSEDQQKQLLQIFKKLLPMLPQLEVEIVGHTDATPLDHRKSKYMQDNMDLSFYRASQALRTILDHHEIKPMQISAKGAGDTLAGSRTLSLTIRPKGDFK